MGILWLAFHFWHITTVINDHDQNDNEEKLRNNVTTTIIVTDSSTGKKDTMLLKDYLKHLK